MSSGVSIHAGFPNPAAERSNKSLSLDQLLLHHPSSNFLFRVRGHEWEDRGIFDGDIAIIDRALTPQASDLIITWYGQEFTLLSFSQLKKDTEAWGTITAIIHQYGSTGIQ